MGQQELLDVLKKAPDRWFTAKELIRISDTRRTYTHLKKLRYGRFVDYNLDKQERAILVNSTLKSCYERKNKRMVYRYKHKGDKCDN